MKMSRNTFPREFYIPKNSAKVADKLSDAVAYVYTTPKGRPAAAMFFGKQAKPAWHYNFLSDASREKRIRETFEGYRASQAAKAEWRDKRKAAGRGLVVGDILNTCWGYEQTNREFFQVTALIGDKMVELREIKQARSYDAQDRGKTVPLMGDFKGEPIRRIAQNGRVKIDDVRRASKTDTVNVGGVQVVQPIYWTAYH
jgi:hypothetical protein